MVYSQDEGLQLDLKEMLIYPLTSKHIYWSSWTFYGKDKQSIVVS